MQKRYFSTCPALFDPSFSRNGKLLHSLFTRGRHSLISTIVATQKFVAIHPIIRTNATELFVYRLRNQKDLDAFLEELSALYDKKTLLKLYQYATDQPFSFLYVKLTAHNRDDMFYMNLSAKLSVQSIGDYWESASAGKKTEMIISGMRVGMCIVKRA